MTNITLNEDTMNEITGIINDELLKRGINSPVTFEQKTYRNGQQGLEVNNGASFQTVPVLFKKIELVAFNSSVRYGNPKNGEAENIVHVWVSMHAQYEHFDRGSNGSKLFDLTLKVDPEAKYTSIHDVRVR